jgi:hypothetical protein
MLEVLNCEKYNVSFKSLKNREKRTTSENPVTETAI